MSLVQGQKFTPFVRLWSTTTINASNLEDRGNLEMRSIETEEKERDKSTARGV